MEAAVEASVEAGWVRIGTGAKLKATLAALVFIMLLSFLFAATVPAHADRGGFGLSVQQVSETGQTAIAAWNGTREVLLLSTDVSSSAESEVVQIMPLPSNPSIFKGETNSFLKVKGLVNTFFEVNAVRSTPVRFYFGTLGMRDQGIPQVEITFQEIIGDHDLTVVKAEKAEELTQWLNGFLESKGYTKPLPSNLGTLLDNYTTEGINFFVVDMISTNSTTKTVEPLTYEFDTLKLYYPLQISDLFSGNTEISLFTLTNNVLETDLALTNTFSKRAQFQIKQDTLEEISPSVAGIFSGNPYLSYFYFKGPLSSFNEDVMARDEPASIASSPAFTASLGAGGFIILCLLFAALRSKKDDSPRNRWLGTISTSTGLVGAALVCVGLSLPWGLAEFNQVLLPENGIYVTSANAVTGPLFLLFVLAAIGCFAYVSLQGCSRETSVFLTVLGTTTAIMILASTAYLAVTSAGFFITLAGATSLTLTGILLRWRINLGPSQPPITGYKAYLTRKLLKALFIMFGVSWVIFLIISILPPWKVPTLPPWKTPLFGF